MEQAFARARSTDAKKRRRQDLLESAEIQAGAIGVRGLTLTSIAQRAGVHVSAVRRYFESREELLLVLAATHWERFALGVVDKVSGKEDVEAVARAIAEAMDRDPLFCDLLSHVAIDLERGVTSQAARTYKIAAIGAVEICGRSLERALPWLEDGLGREAIGDITALGAILWQYATPTPALSALYDSDPRLASAKVDFVARLTRAAGKLLGGFEARRS